MTVEELIDELKDYPPEMKVVIWTETQRNHNKPGCVYLPKENVVEIEI